jgi:hypothetical protein
MEENRTHQIDNPREFLLAGKAVFTVTNSTSGEHFTYQVKAFKNTLYFVSVLTGPDNSPGSFNFKYLCILGDADLTLHLSKKSPEGCKDSKAYKVLSWALKLMREAKPTPTGYTILASSNCAKCGRVLTVETSVMNGMGPECRRKAIQARETNLTKRRAETLNRKEEDKENANSYDDLR